jgi:hypothetical protein
MRRPKPAARSIAFKRRQSGKHISIGSPAIPSAHELLVQTR